MERAFFRGGLQNHLTLCPLSGGRWKDLDDQVWGAFQTGGNWAGCKRSGFDRLHLKNCRLSGGKLRKATTAEFLRAEIEKFV